MHPHYASQSQRGLTSNSYSSSPAPAAIAFEYAPTPAPSSSPPSMGIKRYRSAAPTNAKSFQCTGYGDCRMVFSRSEHLARHIRKHTGERPFTCHCEKQFSRLDNLRQHAQTVHSGPEDQELNERMMRTLSGVNASITANARGRRRYGNPNSPVPSPVSPMYTPSYVSCASVSSPGLSTASSSSSSSWSSLGDPYELPSRGSGHAPDVSFAADCHPSGSHSLPASPSYPYFHHRPRLPSPPSQGYLPVTSPYPQTAPIIPSGANDYMAAGLVAAHAHSRPQHEAVVVKQEEGVDLEEFYRAVCAPPSALATGYDSEASMSPEIPAHSLHYQYPSSPTLISEKELTNAEYYRAVQAQYYYAHAQQHQHHQQPPAGYAFA
ncbi:hypothetical protein MIND_00652100 [Mycena indigotica]|uniref:C2H2-type domain-containing protein n=1 Tax=Mycena indigotica TaxID=2126181 RepID=A0A8H6SSD7_9AGAR|nr:uncharacterized protein MIND_00652100 [Mycena indigotica]KAF7304200.1 hypothetical protein MIND_00652100 [Mycena indigotica]